MGEHRFSVRQSRLLSALLTANSVREAAKIARVSETQAYRLTRDPIFVERWEAMRKETCVLALDLAQREMLNSAKALVAIRDDERMPGQCRVNAASRLLELAEERRKRDHQNEYCDRLEAALAETRAVIRSGDEQPALPAHEVPQEEEEA